MCVYLHVCKSILGTFLFWSEWKQLVWLVLCFLHLWAWSLGWEGLSFGCSLRQELVKLSTGGWFWGWGSSRSTRVLEESVKPPINDIPKEDKPPKPRVPTKPPKTKYCYNDLSIKDKRLGPKHVLYSEVLFQWSYISHTKTLLNSAHQVSVGQPFSEVGVGMVWLYGSWLLTTPPHHRGQCGILLDHVVIIRWPKSNTDVNISKFQRWNG